MKTRSAPLTPDALKTTAARLRLAPRAKPYYVTLAPFIQLGYRRCEAFVGTWCVRCTADGADWTKRIGKAEDRSGRDIDPSDGLLTYWQAQEEALKLANGGVPAAASRQPVTVAEALDGYEADLRARGAKVANATRVRAHMLPGLAAKPVTLLDARDLQAWRNGMVAKGMQPATINRTRVGLRAALELAATLDKRIQNRDVFRTGLKGLPGANNARRIVLPDTDVWKLVDAAFEIDPRLGVYIKVLAETGARKSQALRLRCQDLQAGPRLLMPASLKGNSTKVHQQAAVPISDELAGLLEDMRAGRDGDDRLLINDFGRPWADDIRKPFRVVAKRAGFDPDHITSYALRHSSICRGLSEGVPISIVAKLHDTSSKQIEAHYAKHILDISETLARRGLLRRPPANLRVVS